jgi:hypothetical protein
VPEVYGTASPRAARRRSIGRVVTAVVLSMLVLSIALAGYAAIVTHLRG